MASGTLLSWQHCPWDFPASVGGTVMAGTAWRVQGTASPVPALVLTWKRVFSGPHETALATHTPLAGCWREVREPQERVGQQP